MEASGVRTEVEVPLAVPGKTAAVFPPPSTEREGSGADAEGRGVAAAAVARGAAGGEFIAGNVITVLFV